jgi:hypothetical protein
LDQGSRQNHCSRKKRAPSVRFDPLGDGGSGSVSSKSSEKRPRRCISFSSVSACGRIRSGQPFAGKS